MAVGLSNVAGAWARDGCRSVLDYYAGFLCLLDFVGWLAGAVYHTFNHAGLRLCPWRWVRALCLSGADVSRRNVPMVIL